MHLHSGVGNLGTYSHTGTSRIAAEVLKANWDNCVVERGDTRKGLPWNIGQFGSNTSFTMARTNFVAATDAVNKLKEIAAMDLGGAPTDYDIGGERVFSKADPSKGLTYALACEGHGRVVAVRQTKDRDQIDRQNVGVGTCDCGLLRDQQLKGQALQVDPTALLPQFASGEISLEHPEAHRHSRNRFRCVEKGPIVSNLSVQMQFRPGPW